MSLGLLMEVGLQSFFTSLHQIGVSGHFTCRGRACCIHRIEVGMGLRASLGAVAKGIFSDLAWNQAPVFQSSLYLSHYTDWAASLSLFSLGIGCISLRSQDDQGLNLTTQLLTWDVRICWTKFAVLNFFFYFKNLLCGLATLISMIFISPILICVKERFKIHGSVSQCHPVLLPSCQIWWRMNIWLKT
jgi:hypothetical protein